MNPEIKAKITALRHELHRIPELSGGERETMAAIRAFLTENVIEAEKRTDPDARPAELHDLETGFYLYLPAAGSGVSGAPAAFRADMDALPISEGGELPYASRHPGVAHKCGHDGHSAVLCGLAAELCRRENCGLRGRDIYLIFQQAEETGAGGAGCARLIRQKGIAEVYAFHNWSGFPEGAVVVRPGTFMCASMGLTVCFRGRTAHASQPENGANPAAAAARLILYADELAGVGRLRHPAEPFRAMTLATVVHTAIGSKNFGIAASEGEVSMTLRAEQLRDLTALKERITEKAAALAAGDGLACEFAEADVFPETANDAALTERAAARAQAAGFPVIRPAEPVRSSEDFGWYQKECPGVMFFIGNGEDYPQIHTAGFDFNDRILGTAVDLFLALL